MRELKIDLETFLAMYIGGDYRDECVFVSIENHEERLTTFDGTEVVTAVWLDLDGGTCKLFIELEKGRK